jgi:hypothetical protein
MHYRGCNNHTLHIFSAYCPNSPAGPFTVAIQHREYFNSINDTRNSHSAFLSDIKSDIKVAIEEGDQILLLLDGNSNMKTVDLNRALTNMNLREVLLEKYGCDGPST